MSGGVGVAGLLLWLFATTYLDNSTTANGSTLTERASFEVLALMSRASGARHSEAAVVAVGQALAASAAGQRFLARLQLSPEAAAQHFAGVEASLTAANILADAWRAVAHTGETLVAIEHLLGAYLLQSACAGWLREADLQAEDILFTIWWMRTWRLSAQSDRQWWQPEKILSAAGLGLSFAAGFTPLVDRFSRIPAGNLWDMVNEGRDELVERLILTLARVRQSNVLLVGQPGVGRLGVIQALSRRVRIQQAHPALNGQRVIYLHVGELLAQAASAASQLAIISQVLTEIERAGNIIAIIDGVSSILAEAGEHKVDLTEVLLPFFSSLTVRVVVIISSDEYHLRLKTNEELIHFFEVVQVEPASEAATLRSLARAARFIERTQQISIPYRSLETLVDGTSGILQHIPYPERAFDVLEEAIVVTRTRANRTLLPAIVEELITNKVGIPIGKLKAGEGEALLDLENRMHERLVNQTQAVAALARAMIRARAGVRNTARPIGTFLFMGPTGVGKTEAAKTLAATYFGSEEYLSRLDMSEFQSPESTALLIGNSLHPTGRLTALIADTPFTVLLLDEFEKAHASVKQLFLQVFDEGRLTDARGHTVSFQHAIIIATSNAGAELIRAEAKDGVLPAGFGATLTDHLLSTGVFSPELLNRFDGVITFTPLTPEHLQEVARLLLVKLNARLDKQHGVTVAVTPELIDYLISIGYSPEFGARPLNRAIQDTVEYAIAKEVLAGRTRPGQVLTLSPAQLAAERQS